MQVTITVPDATYRRAERIARVSRRRVADVLADTIELSLSHVGPDPEASPTMSELADAEVVALTELQLPPEQDRRLTILLDRQQAGTLQPDERGTLSALFEIYQEALLRKAEALQEAVRRGLLEPLEP